MLHQMNIYGKDRVQQAIERLQTFEPEEGYYLAFSGGKDSVTVKALESVPSAQPETAKRIVGKSRDGMTLWYQCDMCNEPVDEQDNYCRGCGRRLIDG